MQQFQFVKTIEESLSTCCHDCRIAVYKGKMNSALEKIPSSFLYAIPEILNILSKSLSAICIEKNKGILIVGLKPCVSMIEENNVTHFCCTLEFEIHPLKKLHLINRRTHAYFVVIDFTTGEIMNEDMYVDKLFPNYLKNAEIYGKMRDEILTEIWKGVSLEMLMDCEYSVQNTSNPLPNIAQNQTKVMPSIPFFVAPDLASWQLQENEEISYLPLDHYESQNDDMHYEVSNY